MTDVVDDAVLNELADDLGLWVRGGLTIDAAVLRLARYGTPKDVIDRARLVYERRVGLIRELRDPFALVQDEREKGYWYDGPSEKDVFWPAVRGRLGIGDAIDEVDRSSSKIVGLLRPPGADEIDTRGLVLGYVQSGKTTSFTSVIAKAADAGYRLFIVLSGITDNLRTQTQLRLQQTLVGDQLEVWHLLTDEETDFHRRDNAPNVLSRPDQRLLAVVKKNPYRLHRLLTWLDSAGETALRGCPIMIVDDEADQASIDVGSAGRRSRINNLIRQILQKPKAAYVAYTATPFANLLIDPDDPGNLYPRDFIVDLKPGPSYYGPERVFGREALTPEEEGSPELDGLDVVRSIPIADIAAVQPPKGKGAVDTWDPSVPDSLRDAVQWFLLSTAARVARGSTEEHSSMLVHTSMLAAAHEKVAAVVGSVLAELTDGVHGHDAEVIERLRRQWAEEQARVPAESQGEQPVDWTHILTALPEVVSRTRIVIDNYRSDDRLIYSPDEPTYVIAVGGNTLSRGLTLEGLVCSYFVRAASAYDTLLQMGRWFGYRRGYADLARVWMTDDLARWFFDLATVEEEVRRDIRKYDLHGEALTPTQAAVRIRTHPSMAITSAAKMRAAIRAEVSYGGTRQQTILFDRDPEWLRSNLEAVRRLVADLRSDPDPEAGTNRDGRPMFTGVPSSMVVDFLKRYNFHPQARTTTADLLTTYIQRENDSGYLPTWNIVVLEHPDDDNGIVDLGFDRPVNLIERARLDMPGIAHANIKSLVSTIDRVADVTLSRQEISSEVAPDPISDANLLTLREQIIGDVGLLCIYPISKDSRPRNAARAQGKRRRLPMDAPEHLLGLGIFFPTSRGGSRVTYMSADLSTQVIEDVPHDLTEIDSADEAALAAEDRREQETAGAPGNGGA